MLNINDSDKFKDNMGKGLFILSLFILGLMVFLIFTKPFMHIDEWFTQGILNISFKEMINLTARDVHPPLYYAIALVPVYLFKWLHIPFNMMTLMKMMSVVPYVIIFAISLTKIRKDYGWLAGGLFAFTLLTMADFFTMFSIARMYPWGLLFLVVSFLYACEILRNPSLKSWILLAFFSVCGAYTHYFVAMASFVLYVSLFVHILLKNKSELKNWFISVIFGIACFVPWLFFLFDQVKSVSGDYWIEAVSFETFVQFFASIFMDTSEFYINLALAIVFLAIFICILIYYMKSKEDADIVLIGSIVFIGTVLIGVGISYAFRPIFVVRYIIPATGLIWLCLSIFISKFDLKRVIIPVVIILLLFSVANLGDQINEISKNHEDLVKNQEFLQSINSNDSVVIIDGMVKYVHFHDQLNDSIVYGGFSVGEREKAKDFTLFFDDKDTRFLMPDDFDKYKDKSVYLAYRKGSDIKLPKNVTKDKIGKVDNTKFYKLTYKG